MRVRLRRSALAAAALALFLVGAPPARAGDQPAAPAAAPPPTAVEDGAYQLEFANAASAIFAVGDTQASWQGIPVTTWLRRLASDSPAEAAAARDAFLGLGRDAIPWLSFGVTCRTLPALHEPSAALAREVLNAAGIELERAASDPRVAYRRLALGASRRGGLSDAARRSALDDDDPIVRRETATGYLVTGVSSPEAVKALERAAESEDSAAREAAMFALLRSGGPAADRILHELERPEARAKLPEGTLRALPPEAVDGALRLLTSRSWPVRAFGARHLALLPRLTEQAVAAAVRLLEDSSGAVRWLAATALDAPEARSAVPALRKLLDDPVPPVAGAAAVALGAHGVEVPEAVRPLVVALLSTHEVGIQDPWVISQLAEWGGRHWYVLARDGPPVEVLAKALARFGARGVEPLRLAAKDSGAVGRRHAVTAYAAAGAAGVPALVEALDDEATKRPAILGLARAGDARVEVVRGLATRVYVDSNGVRGEHFDDLFERLEALKALKLSALPSLRALLPGADSDLRGGLAAGIVALGDQAAPAIPEVLTLPNSIAILPGESSGSVSLFERAIRSIGAAGVPNLVLALGSENPATRRRAYDALVLLGPLAKPALPELRAALDANRIEGITVMEADWALRRIEADK